MTSYQLRKANDHDRDRIAEIWHSSASLPDVGPPQMPSYDDLRARVDELGVGCVVTVAQGEEGLIGFVAIKPAQRLLAELFVCSRHLRSGIGKALLDDAKRAMADGFTLFTTSTNARARRFYECEGSGLDRDGAHPRSGPLSAVIGEAAEPAILWTGQPRSPFRRNARARRFYDCEGPGLDREGAHPRSVRPVSAYRWDG